ncbi:nucleotidyltransferase family protein [Spongiimicrobium sp. 3-5]|uniref:nucleotidyltransferase family protein n=1 Tax=Spongiimicrobium sp. 3-5 TaxID=3332596 RepID=UPI00397FCB85
MRKDSNIAIMVLAAGASVRMSPHIKQLLPWKNTTLLGSAIATARASNAEEIVTVLGANAQRIKAAMALNGHRFIENKNWKQGMGSSIATGTEYFLNHKKQYNGILIMLADQPLLDSAYLNKMMDDFSTHKKGIVATTYAEKYGVPAVFGKAYYKELKGLSGAEGAKELLARHLNDVIAVDPQGKTVDIDTMADYNKLK